MPDELSPKHLARRLIALAVFAGLVAAAVVIYRTFQLGIPAILGAIAFVQLRRTLRDSPEPGRMCGAPAEQ